MNRKGFAYIVAVLILGLLAFMGLFLIQSSSAEYSQTAISVYRTMAHQLAEAAGEEAYVMLEERFKDKTDTGFLQQLLWQASTSNIPVNGGSTGLNPTLLHDFSDLKDKVSQTNIIKDHFMTRAGFVIEKVIPSIKDLRPIPNKALDNPTCYYQPRDRITPFDNPYSRDFYLTLKIDIRVTLQKRRKMSLDYTLSRDVKLLNLGPIGRNYTLFSILTHYPSSNPTAFQAAIRNEMNSPDVPGGRLFLWNQPFQSRVYLHGPSIIALENPELATDRPGYGAYNIGDPKTPQPNQNQAFQYSDTFFGFSYFTTASRAIFPPKSMWDSISVWWRGGKESKDDMSANQSYYPGVIEHATVYGGLLPHRDRSFGEVIGDISSNGIQDKYLRGTNIHQKFLPAGPFCRTPWKYVSPGQKSEDVYNPNNVDDYKGEGVSTNFPKDDPSIRIEHHWDKDDPKVDEQNRIYARTYEIKYNNVTNNIKDPPDERLIEFALSYYNDPDPETIFGKIGYTVSAWGESFWKNLTMPFEAVGVLVSPVWGKIFGEGEDSALSTSIESETKNLFPTNFKMNYSAFVTRRFSGVEDIPTDEGGRWLLDGVYWLDTFQTDSPIVYIGTGTIIVSKFNPDKPIKIRGSIVCKKAADGITPLGHLNLMIMPVSSAATDPSQRMLTIEGSGNTIEASVFSFYGIKTDSGNIPDFAALGMDASVPMDKWGNFFPSLTSKTNIILGNYVNYFMNKQYQRGDLWVLHNVNNPLYFDRVADTNWQIVQKRIDADDNGKKAYALMTHEF